MFEGCSPEPAGGLLEVPGDGVPRWMVVVSPTLRRRRFTGSGLHAGSFAHTCRGFPGRTQHGVGQTGRMSNNDEAWYYDVRTKTVAQGKESGALDRMGPYPDRETAERAIQIAEQRNKAADKADDDWNN